MKNKVRGDVMFFRTDMAVERRDIYRTANKLEEEINGIECEEVKRRHFDY